MNARMHIGLVFGGASAEHEVSEASAKNIYLALDKDRYDVSLIRIDMQGCWRLEVSDSHLLGKARGDHALRGDPVFLAPSSAGGGRLFSQGAGGLNGRDLDVVFPVLHGPNGEDGTVQGLLRTVGVPYVGAGVLGSAIGMDKDVMKRLLQDAGIPVPRFQVAYREDKVSFVDCAKELGLPFFVKPANAGSSVGISKVADRDALEVGLNGAFRFDHKVIVEERICGRELECAVIGNEHARVSVPGEIVTQHDFYSYKAKYQDENATTLIIPAPMPNAVAQRLATLAAQTYRTLCCEGMARVDFFLDANDAVYVNELNSIPGFTDQSMFPLLWEHSGLSFPELVDELIRYALERHERDARLRRIR